MYCILWYINQHYQDWAFVLPFPSLFVLSGRKEATHRIGYGVKRKKPCLCDSVQWCIAAVTLALSPFSSPYFGYVHKEQLKIARSTHDHVKYMKLTYTHRIQ